MFMLHNCAAANSFRGSGTCAQDLGAESIGSPCLMHCQVLGGGLSRHRLESQEYWHIWDDQHGVVEEADRHSENIMFIFVVPHRFEVAEIAFIEVSTGKCCGC